MKNYFFNLNQKYLKTFSIKVIDRFKKEFIHTDESFIKILFREINELFKHLGGRTSSKHDIPKKGDFPDTIKFNRLVNSISDDIDKLYAGQRLVEDDLNNLMLFNSSQRQQTFENMVSTQQKIFKIFIKNKKDLSGEIVIENSFQSTDQLSTQSQGVFIDETRGVLTLDSTFIENKPIDTENVVIHFTGKKPDPSIYPNNNVLRPGSHWRIPDQAIAHFVDINNPSVFRNYMTMMIDTPNVNTGVGWTEFEAVRTELIGTVIREYREEHRYQSGGGVTSPLVLPKVIRSSKDNKEILALKNEVGKLPGFNRDPELIYMDVPNSLQGKFAKRILTQTDQTSQEEEYKLVIPFKNAKITNEVAISFAPIEGDIPKILWNKSVLFSNSEGQEISYNIISPNQGNETSDDGYYICKFLKFLAPSRLELILTFGGDPWHLIPFEMSHYTYFINKPYELPQESSGSRVSILLGKHYDILVDSEPNKDAEKTRAVNVIAGRRG